MKKINGKNLKKALKFNLNDISLKYYPSQISKNFSSAVIFKNLEEMDVIIPLKIRSYINENSEIEIDENYLRIKNKNEKYNIKLIDPEIFEDYILTDEKMEILDNYKESEGVEFILSPEEFKKIQVNLTTFNDKIIFSKNKIVLYSENGEYLEIFKEDLEIDDEFVFENTNEFKKVFIDENANCKLIKNDDLNILIIETSDFLMYFIS